MARKLKKTLAFVLAFTMMISMFLDVPGGIFGNAVGTITASAAGGVTFETLDGTDKNSYEGCENLIDGDVDTKWMTYVVEPYIIFKASEEVHISGYDITTGNDTATYPERNPDNWTLYGCNDYTGSDTGTWEVLHTVEDDSILQGEDNVTFSYTFKETEKKYQYFKLYITGNSSGMQMSEFALHWRNCDHVWEEAGTVSPDCLNGGYNIWKCNVCGEEKKIDNGTEPLGHLYQDGVCTREGCDVPPYSEEDSCYEISTAGQLCWFAKKVRTEYKKYGGANVVLKSDITVNNNLLESLTFDNDGYVTNGTGFTEWTPIGENSRPYTGKFDGAGYKISGLYCNDIDSVKEEVGLFGCVGADGSVSKVGVTDSYFYNPVCAGGICGVNNGTISNSYCIGTVDGGQKAGGICGMNNGTISNCFGIGKVNSYYDAGGVCGYNDGTIHNCYYDRTVYTGVAYNSFSGNSAMDFGRTTAQFQNGEVAYLLSKGTGGETWGQEIGVNEYPVLEGMKVYATTGCATYNNKADESHKDHDYREGVCIQCGEYDTPVLESDTYKLSKIGDLYWFADYVNSGNASAKAILVNDIEVNDNLLDSLVIDQDGNVTNGGSFKEWIPIGNASNPYTGTFDGDGHTISGLYGNWKQERIGLFGSIASRATIKGVGVEDSYFEGNAYVGSLCGYSESYSTITNSYGKGIVKANVVSMRVLSESAGGLCGYNSYSSIKDCYYTGIVEGNADYVGGVCGFNEGTIDSSYGVVTVKGDSEYKGGICGFNSSSGTITNSYYDEDVYTGYAVGGGSGNKDGAISKTTAKFKSGEVAHLLSKGAENTVWRQELGKDVYPVFKGEKIVYATTGCVTYNNDGITGTKSHDYKNGICKDCSGYREPNRNANNECEIEDKGNLYWFRDYVNAGHTSVDAVLKADVIVNEELIDSMVFDNEGNVTNEQNFDKWIPIGTYTQPYTGTFDGKEFTIKGLYFNDAKVDNVGLFGYVGKKGVVSNVSVSDFYLKGKAAVGSVCGYNSAGGTIGGSCLTGKVSGEDYVGGVCGRNDGTVINSYSTAEVCDGNYIGGICGYNYAGGTISNSYNTGLVSGRQKVGGVCGKNIGTICNSYSIGKINGTRDIGAVCGSNSGTVCNSYSLKTQNGYDTVGVNDGFNGAEIKTANRFASGEIAYLLAQGCSIGEGADEIRYEGTVWGQTLSGNGKESYPVLNGAKVYVTTGCVTYTNTENPGEGIHDYQEGVCTHCGGYVTPNCENDTYEISNMSDLYWFANYVNAGNTSANAVLTGNITVNQELLESLTFDNDGNATNGADFTEWTPIGTASHPYIGTFSGNGYTVSGLYYDYQNISKVGTFGYTENGANISEVGVADSYFRGQDDVGSVCGYNKGIISNTYCTGEVKGDVYVGGICGRNENIISNSQSTGTVSGNRCVGAVCGYNNLGATISNSYYNSTNYSGNAVGRNWGNVSDVSGKTVEEFQTGEIAYILSQGCTIGEGEGAVDYPGIAWGQKLTGEGKENFPILNSAKVYRTKKCIIYSNKAEDNEREKEHNYGKDGICLDCGEYQTPEIVDGVYQIVNKGNLLCLNVQKNYKAVVCDEVILTESFTIPEGSVLTIGKDGSLSGAEVVVNGELINESEDLIESGGNSTGKLHCDLDNDGYCDCTSDCEYREVFNTFNITAQPKGGNADLFGTEGEGLIHELTVEAAAKKESDSITYQWYQIGKNNTEIPISDAASKTFALPLSEYQIGETHSYRCEVTCEGKTRFTDIVTVNVVKKSGYTVADISKTYAYLIENADVIPLDDYLPDRCRNVQYGTPQVSGDVAYEVNPSVTDGKLSFTLKKGDIGAEGTIKVAVTSENYEDFTITVKVQLLDLIPVYLKEDTKGVLKNNYLTYGEPLSKLKFNNVVFVDKDGNRVAGTISWKDPSVVPDTNSGTWVFTPDDKRYVEVEGTAEFMIVKATPYIAVNPTAEAITYGETLSDSALTGGIVQFSDSDTKAVEGSFAWKELTLKPSVSDSNSTEYVVVFTPDNNQIYNTVSTTVKLTVNKAQYSVNIPGSVMNVSYSIQKVSDITLPEGWAWQDTDKNKVLEVGKTVVAKAVYEGEDVDNYEITTVDVTITRTNCEHTHTLLKKRKVATCIQKGYSGDTYCKDCGVLVTSGRELPLADHKGGTATCTEQAICSECGEKYGEIDSHNHENTVVKNEKKATCTKEGYSGDTCCTDCGKKIGTGTIVKALGHKYKSKVTKKATTSRTGIRTYTCSRCGHSYTKSIPKLPIVIPAKGKKLTDTKTKIVYTVTKAGKKGSLGITGGEVAYTKSQNSSAKTINIPSTVKLGGIKYKVTSIRAKAFANNKKLTKVTIGKNIKSIGSKAFYGCKKLKTITVKTTKLTSSKVGSKAFKGIYAKAIVKVPKSKYKAYKKILKSRGIGTKVKIIK